MTITGTNFASGATVTFGSAAATNVMVVNSTTITATTPAGSAGAVTVTVTNVGSQGGSLASGFTYTMTGGLTAPGSFSGALTGTAAPTYVSGQEYYNATAGNSFTTSAFNSTGADLLLMFLGCHNTTVFTITDSFGNTWLPLAGPAYKAGSSSYPMEGEFFYAPNAKTGAGHTITVRPQPVRALGNVHCCYLGRQHLLAHRCLRRYHWRQWHSGPIYLQHSINNSQPNELLLGIVKGFGNNTYTALGRVYQADGIDRE